MENLIKYLKERTAVLLLPAVLLAAGIFPSAAVADGELALDTGGRRGGHEGDPLDGNEPDGDPASGDDVHDTAGLLGSKDDFLSRLMRSTNVLLVPQYNGSILTFRVIFLADSGEVVEGRYAQ